MELIWHGTACIEIICGEGRILFDPFVPLKGSEAEIDIEEFDGFTDIFITHGHFDHIVSVPEVCSRNPDVRIYCTETPYNTLMGKGVPVKNLRLIRFGDEMRINGADIKTYHGRHAVLPKATPQRLRYILSSDNRDNIPFIVRENRICRENDETVFYEIRADGKTVSLMGSLNLREDTQYPVESDLLILPYNGWEDNYPPACSVIEKLNPAKVFLDHYDDTFPPVTMKLDLTPIMDRFPGMVVKEEYNKAIEV